MFDRKIRVAEELLKIAEDLIGSRSGSRGKKIEVERLARWANYDEEGNLRGYYIDENELDAWAIKQCTGGKDIYDYAEEMGFEDIEDAYVALSKECGYIDEEGYNTEEAREKFEEEYRCRLIFEEQSNAIFPVWTIIPEEWDMSEVARLKEWAKYDRFGNFRGYYIDEEVLDAWAVRNGLDDAEGKHTSKAIAKFEEEYRCKLEYDYDIDTGWYGYVIIPEEWK